MFTQHASYCNRLTLFTVSFCEKEANRRHPGEMTVLLLFQKTAGYNQLLPLPRPLNNSRPIGVLYPCASAVTPLSEVSYTPFGTAETHQCPSLKQENSLIFGPWLPIHVFFYTKATQCYTFHQNTIQLINFSVWTPFKMWSILDFNGSLPLKKRK